MREELRQIVVRAHDSERRDIAPRIEDAQSASLLWTASGQLVDVAPEILIAALDNLMVA